jgi:hypothetical protein
VRTRSTTLTLAAGAVVALVAAACDHQPTQPATPVLSQVQANEMAQGLTTDMDLLSSSLTFEPTALSFEMGGEMAGVATPALSSPCPTISPLPPANQDHDRVPDSVRFDFTGCIFTGPTVAVSLSGTIDIVDPTPTDSDRAIEWKFGDFTRSVTRLATGGTFTVKQNGIRTVIASADALSHTETNFRTDFTYPDGSTASHVRDWKSVFTADVPGSIQPDMPLPSGLWSIAGTSTFTKGDRSYSLMVSTDPSLHRNASCTVRPKFDSGTLHAQITRVNGTTTTQTTVVITFTGCGQYTVTVTRT